MRVDDARSLLASGEVLNVDVWDCSGHPVLAFAQQVLMAQTLRA